MSHQMAVSSRGSDEFTKLPTNALIWPKANNIHSCEWVYATRMVAQDGSLRAQGASASNNREDNRSPGSTLL